jgi:penicillin-binding protein 1A
MSRKKRRPRRRVLPLVVVAVVLLALVLVGFSARTVFGPSCNLASLKPVDVGRNSFVYGASGSLLGVLPADHNRTPVTRAQMSPWLRKATVAIEDRRFYHHGGVDPIGIVRALVTDLRDRRFAQGGSTITQELVRNLYLTRDRTLSRKLTEACLAVKLSRQWTRDRILTAYLNQVYYGNHAYGVEAAAQTYFARPARTLTLEQAALIAGLPQAPSLYDPFVSPTLALARRDAVLHALLVSGDVTRAQYDAARADRSLHLRAGSTKREPAVFAYVEDLLQKEYGTNTVREGGLRIYTTIDGHLQRAADAAIHSVLALPTDPATALISIDPVDGAIRAMAVADPGNAVNELNFATSASRQPGSTFKAIALTAAVERGMNPYAASYLSAPFAYGDWHVSTFDHTYQGLEPVVAATLQSDNTVYARLALDVGAQNIVDTARKLGIRTSALEPYPSIALGSESVTPLEEASAYATLAAGGVYSRPYAIRTVVFPGGRRDTAAGWGEVQRERAVPDWVAATVTKVLEQNMLRGTGRAAHVAGRSDAGKTGTTTDFADAWFSGYTPSLEATVWVGYARGEVPMLDVHGIAVSGGTFPAQIWHAFMSAAAAGRPDAPFPPPATPPHWTAWSGTYEYGPGGPPRPASPTTTTTASVPATTAPVAPTVESPPPAFPVTTDETTTETTP